jgi:hypothetical protein
MPPTRDADALSDNAAHRMIPGAYEPRPPNRRQPGAMGGAAFGTDGIASPSTMAAATIAEREKEGGGGVGSRPRRPVR